MRPPPMVSRLCRGIRRSLGRIFPRKTASSNSNSSSPGATSLSAEFDDRKFTGSHYGHICFVRMTPTGVTLADQKDGSMRNDIYEMKDPAKKAEKAKLLEGRSITYPVKIETETWHTMSLETVGDSMRATLDGKPVAFLKSSGSPIRPNRRSNWAAAVKTASSTM